MLTSELPAIVSINISKGGIPKLPLPSVLVTFAGLEGDGHNHAKHNTPLQAVCLQDIEELEELTTLGYSLKPGQAGENVTVKGLRVNTLALGTILECSGGVILEITKVRKPCYVMDAIGPRLKEDVLGRHGMYAKVLNEGLISVGETINAKINSQRDSQPSG